MLAAAVAVTAVWAYVLLGRSPGRHPWLAPMIVTGGLVATAALAAVRVLQGKIHYFVGGGRNGPGGRGGGTGSDAGSDAAQKITEWVAAHYAATTVGGVVLYDLTSPSA